MTKNLHVASSFQELTNLVQVNFKNFKTTHLYKSAEKLFNTGLGKVHDGDEEMAYIYFLRFILIYEYLEKMRSEAGYTKKRLGSEYATVTMQLSRLKEILNSRYEEKKKTNSIPVPLIQEFAPPPAETPIAQFPSGYITSCELFNLLQKDNGLVILDARPKDDFQQSSMKNPCCVNIPEEIIKSGLSANKLSEQVPKDSNLQWEKRWKSSLTILLDWASTKENITASKLSVLKDILINWDTGMNNNNNMPIILTGGYLDWLQKYPMYCTNPDVVYTVQNSVLNDLLDLDTIEYPSTEETIPGIYPKPSSQLPAFDRSTKPGATSEKVLTLQENVFNKEKELELKQIEYERNMEELMKKRQQEAEEGMRLELQLREEKLLEDKDALVKKQLEIDDENEKLRAEVENLKFVLDNQTNLPVQDSKDDLDVRQRLLLEAREKKKDLNLSEITAFPLENKKYTERRVPEVDRTCKPISNHPLETVPGTVGIQNFGNTCFQNSILQCLAQTRTLYLYFSDNNYLYDINENLGTCGHMTKAFAAVMKSLWSGEKKVIAPTNFRSTFIYWQQAVGDYNPKYVVGEQQDAHEFMLTLNNLLHDDLKQDIDRPRQVVWTPKQQAWVEQAEGKYSVFTATFFGQSRYTITCENCSKSKSRYELFEHLALNLQMNGIITLERCITKYFEKQPVTGYSCPQCSKQINIFQTVTLVSHPPVLVFLLKRFCEKLIRGKVRLSKNDVHVRYPLENLMVHHRRYYLYAVVVHIGSLNQGHYYCYCRHLRNNKWYKYNDTRVSEVDTSVVMQPKGAFMLFYRIQEEEMLAKVLKDDA